MLHLNLPEGFWSRGAPLPEKSLSCVSTCEGAAGVECFMFCVLRGSKWKSVTLSATPGSIPAREHGHAVSSKFPQRMASFSNSHFHCVWCPKSQELMASDQTEFVSLVWQLGHVGKGPNVFAKSPKSLSLTHTYSHPHLTPTHTSLPHTHTSGVPQTHGDLIDIDA